MTEPSSGQRKLVGRCRKCGMKFDLTDAPRDLDVRRLPCQAVIGLVGGEERAMLAMAGQLMSTVRTEQGITVVRPCDGRLYVQGAPWVRLLMPL